ncbi:MAG: ABC transporter permease [Deltaproteobacteria bacterium]|nr:ABC transporter permease [Deltaproteobacteria bacterium]MBI3389367.1 ABC transporter permease [Deltaproteobacteria bacterium]
MNWRKLLWVTRKDLRLIARDRSALVSLIVVPIIVILVVAETQGGGSSNILLPIVNEDEGPVANALIKVFREHLDVQVVDRARAEALVRDENQAAAMLVLPGGMSKRYLTNKPSTIELLTDPAQGTELSAIKAVMLLADREAASLGDPFHEELLDLQERALTGKRLKFSSLEQNVPGFSVTFVLLSLLFSVSFGLRDEEAWGTSGRIAIAPVTPWAVLGGKLFARILVGAAQLTLLLGFGHFMYHLSLGHSVVAFVLTVFAIVFSMACFSMIIAAIARTREQIIPAGLSSMFILASIGGCWWPFFEQPKWMQTIAQAAMTTWSMLALHDVMLREKTLMEIAPELLFLFAYGGVSFLIGQRLFRYAET